MLNKKRLFNWATRTLKSYAIDTTHPIEPVRLLPWSEVYRVKTNRGFIYIKQNAEPFKVEGSLLTLFNNLTLAHVPTVIAEDASLRGIVMHNAGCSLCNQLKTRYDVGNDFMDRIKQTHHTEGENWLATLPDLLKGTEEKYGIKLFDTVPLKDVINSDISYN